MAYAEVRRAEMNSFEHGEGRAFCLFANIFLGPAMRFKFLLILLIALVAQSVRAEDRDYIAGPWRYGTSWATAGSNGQSHNHSTEKSALDVAINSINASLWTCSPTVMTVTGEWSHQEIVAGFSSYGVRYFNGERGQFSASLYGNGIGTTCNANIGIGGITMVRNRVVSCPAGYSAIGGGTLPCRPNDLPPEKNDCHGRCPNYKNQTLPIHSGMGYQNEIENDYSSASSVLSFERYYISATHRAPSLLGNNWRHTYSRALSINQNSILIDRPDSGRRYFTLVNSVWTPDAGFSERLEHSVGGGWMYTDNSDKKNATAKKVCC